MAIVEYSGKEHSIRDGAKLIGELDKIGINYGCQSGNCGKCIVTVVEGIENLSKKTDAENDFGLFENERLLCQCSINGERVKVEV